MTNENPLKVTVEDVMTTSKQGSLFLGGVKIEDAELKNLQEEAKMLKGTRIWSVLTNTLKEQAKQAMFEKATNWDDMVYGKALLYTIGVQENIIRKLTE